MGNSAPTSPADALAAFYKTHGVAFLIQNDIVQSPEIMSKLRTLLSDAGDAKTGGSVAALGGDCGCGGNPVGHVGGYSDLSDYANSAYSAAKETLIRAVAKEVLSQIGKHKEAASASTAPIEKVVDSLVKLVPKPSTKKGKNARMSESFKKNSAGQIKLCRAMATAINKHFKNDLIPMDNSDNEICNKVGEFMYTLLTGLHTEFMSVAGDLVNTLRNIQTVASIIEQSYKKQTELVAASGDARLRMQSENVADFYNKLQDELRRQLAMCSNLLNVTIAPKGAELITLLAESGESLGLLRDIKDNPGSAQFSDKLAYLLSGFSSIARSAELINKALKALGMTVNEFKSAKNLTDLKMKVYNHIAKQSPTSKELDRMMAASEVILNTDWNHKDIVAYIDGRSGKKSRGGDGDGDAVPMDVRVESKGDVEAPMGASMSDATAERTGGITDEDLNRALNADVSGGADGDSDDEKDGADEKHERADNVANIGGTDISNAGSIAGGDEDDNGEPKYWKRKSIGTLIKKKEKYRKQLLDNFRVLLRRQHVAIIADINEIAQRVGSGIPITDDLERFCVLFERLPDVDAENVHIALSGYAQDANSKQKREEFINNYEIIQLALEPLSKGAGGEYFRALANDIQMLVKAINTFAQTMVKAITEIHIDNPEEIRASIRKTADIFESSIGVTGAGGDDPMGSGKFPTLTKAKEVLRYYINISNIKSALAVNVEETKDFSADYKDLLGDESGWLISAIKAEYDELVEKTKPDAPVPVTEVEYITKIHAGLSALYTSGAADAKERAKAAHKGLSYLWGVQAQAKEHMILAAQSVDLYLKEFTDGLGRNPDTIKSIIQMLDKTTVVAKWFHKNTGDLAEALMDCFPYGINPADGSAPMLVDNIVTDSTINVAEIKRAAHTYEWLEAQMNPRGGAVADLAIGAADDKYPGNPFIGRRFDEKDETKAKKNVENLIVLVHNIMKNLDVITNFLSLFDKVGMNLSDKSFLTPASIKKYLTEYICVSAITHMYRPHDDKVAGCFYTGYTFRGGYRDAAGTFQTSQIPTQNSAIVVRPTLAQVGDDKFVDGQMTVATRDLCGIRTGVGSNNNVAITPEMRFHKSTALALSAIPHDGDYWNYHSWADRKVAHTDKAGYTDFFYDTDILFQMTVKSIACKILTVVDVYRLFHRPTVDRRTHDSLSPLRTIIGGSGHVKVVPEALELYMRLVLLAEWYRENFGFKKDRAVPGDQWQLSIVPNIDGIWSEFVDLIFNQGEHVSEGNYSEHQLQKIIEAINDIYRAYKSKYPKSTTRAIMQAFVVEMNRMMGFIKQKEIEKYLSSRRDFLNTDNNYDTKENDLIDYKILGEEPLGRAPAPSDKFTNNTLKIARRKERQMQHLQKEIQRIRNAISSQFNEFYAADRTAGYSSNTRGTTFIETLRQYRNELNNANGDADKYKVVLRMLQSGTRMSNISVDNLVMLHESVVAPLKVLHATFLVLAKFNSLLHGGSLKNIAKYIPQHPETKNVLTAQFGAMAIRDGPSYEEQLTRTVAQKIATFYPEHKFKSNDPANNRDLDFWSYSFAQQMVSVLELKDADAMTRAGVGAGRLDDLSDADHADSVRAITLHTKILTALMDLKCSSRSLIDANIAAGRINADFSKIQEMCTNLLMQIKSNINKLKFDFPNETELFAKYEDVMHIGSTRWLEENMVEVLFKDRDRCGLDSAVNDHLVFTLEALYKPRTAANPTIANGFVGTLDDSLRRIVYYSVAGDATHNLWHNANYCHANNLTTFPFNAIPIVVEKDLRDNNMNRALITLQKGPAAQINVQEVESANMLTKAPVITCIPQVLQTHNGLVSDTPANDQTSLLLVFNYILQRYLFDSLEQGAEKIYPGLFEEFMNSAASLEVNQGKAFPNVRKLANPGGRARIDAQTTPPIVAVALNAAESNIAKGTIPAGAGMTEGSPASVLFASTALALRGLMNSVDSKLKKKKFLYESAAEIPEYMKDRMRCNLPFYSKLFAFVNERASLLRDLLNNLGGPNHLKDRVSSCLPAPTLLLDTEAAIPVAQFIEDVSAQFVKTGGKSSAERTQHFNMLLTRIIELSQSIKKCCDSTYKELTDVVPYFMELGKDFIADYKSRNGTLPYMPASYLAAPMAFHNDSGDPPAIRRSEWPLLPSFKNGSPSYKFNYAARFLLGNPNAELTPDHIPGAKNIYQAYSTNASRVSMITQNEYFNTIKHMAKLARYDSDGMVYGYLFRPRINAPSDYVFGVSTALNRVANENGVNAFYVAPPGAGVPVYNANVGVYGRSVASALPFVLDIGKLVMEVENTNVQNHKELLTSVIGENFTATRYNRSQARILNLIETGTVPLNVHSFMKEIPFANLINYAFTYDDFVSTFILPSYDNEYKRARNDLEIIRSDTRCTTSRQLFAKLLIAPWADLSANRNDPNSEYYALLAGLYNGYHGMKFAIPRFLSDQLFHKVLLTSSVQYASNSSLPYTLRGNDLERDMAGGPASYEAVRNAVQYAPTSGMNAAKTNTLRVANSISPYLNTDAGTLMYDGAGLIQAYTSMVDVLHGAPCQPPYSLAVDSFIIKSNTRNAHAFIDAASENLLSAMHMLTQNKIAFVCDSSLGGQRFTPAEQFLTGNAPPQVGNAGNIDIPARDLSRRLQPDGTPVNDHPAPHPLVRGGVDQRHKILAFNISRILHALDRAGPANPQENYNNLVRELKQLGNNIYVNINIGNVLGYARGLRNAVLANPNAIRLNLSSRVADALPAGYADQRLTYDILLRCREISVNMRECVFHMVMDFWHAIGGAGPAAFRQYASYFPDGLINDPLDAYYTHASHELLLTSLADPRMMQLEKLAHVIGFVNVSAIHYLRDLIAFSEKDGYNVPLVNNLTVVPLSPMYPANMPVSTPGLKFYAPGPNGGKPTWRTVPNPMPMNKVTYCAELGRARFDTKFIRNIAWFTKIQLLLRLVMDNHLAWIDTPVVDKIAALQSDLTEYQNNKQYDDHDYDGTNYELI